MRSSLGGIDLEMAIHTEAFACRAEQRQEYNSEGVSVVRWFETLLAFWSGGSGSLGCGLNYAAFS
jgi:hypothetical protein